MYMFFKRNLSSSIEKLCRNNDRGRRKRIKLSKSWCWTRWWFCWRWTSWLIMIDNIEIIGIFVAIILQYKWRWSWFICRRSRWCNNNWSFMKNFFLMWWNYWCIEIILCVMFMFVMNLSRLKIKKIKKLKLWS